MNLNLKIIAVYDSLLKRIESFEAIINDIKKAKGDKGDKGDRGERGRDGKDGKDGIHGANGIDGKDGRDGIDGKDGTDGKDGKDGISVSDAEIEDDGHLYITLSDGREIDAGEVVSGSNAKMVSVTSHAANPELKWIDYASNWASEPTAIDTQPEGTVYLYTYLNGFLYRFVPESYSSQEDAFYRRFESGALSGKVASRGMRI
jgi:hypothetical protein